MSEPRPDPVVQYVIHPALRGHLDAYFAALGFEVSPLPGQSPDDLPTFLVSPTAARLRAVRSGEPVPNLAAPSLPPVLDPLFETVDGGTTCAGCSHPSMQHLAVRDVVTCSMCSCRTRRRA